MHRCWTGVGLCAFILVGCGRHDSGTSAYHVALASPGGPSIMPVGPGPAMSPGTGFPVSGPVPSLGSGSGGPVSGPGGPGTAGHIPVCFGIGVCPPLDDPRTHPRPPFRYPPVWAPMPPPATIPVQPPFYGSGVGSGVVLPDLDPLAERIARLTERLQQLVQLRAQLLGPGDRVQVDLEIQAIREELNRLGVDV